MKKENGGWRVLLLASAFAATSFGCGGGGGGDGGGGGTATVSGNLSSVSTVAKDTAKSTWLARLGEELLGLAKRAYAQATGLDGVTVTVSRGSSQATDETDDDGDFNVGGAPTGDVTVSFARGNCNASLSLPDVADGSTLDLQDTTLACNSASPGKIAETFQGVILNKPSSPNGNLNVCAFGGGGNHNRAVASNGAQFVDTSFDDLEEGDLIEATGERAGNGANSTLFATSIQRIGSGTTGQCGSIPTPSPTSTPEPTATPTETPTP